MAQKIECNITNNKANTLEQGWRTFFAVRATKC